MAEDALLFRSISKALLLAAATIWLSSESKAIWVSPPRLGNRPPRLEPTFTWMSLREIASDEFLPVLSAKITGKNLKDHALVISHQNATEVIQRDTL